MQGGPTYILTVLLPITDLLKNTLSGVPNDAFLPTFWTQVNDM